MAERKPISKKMRFEVFKRDNFTCQYCGRHAPDVVLECDHIKPVSAGGKNTMLNLVTACMECNRGKGKRKLSDTAEIDKQFEQLSILQERREQMKMMLKWREELEQFENDQIDVISKILCTEDKTLTDYARAKVKMLIKKYGFSEVVTATSIAHDKYIVMRGENLDFAFDKIGGICYNRAQIAERGGKEWV